MTTLTVQRPQNQSAVIGSLTANFTACTAADKFSCPTGSGSYMIYYRNGGTTGVTTLWALSTSAAAPAGVVPGVPTGATNWEDLPLASTVATSTDRVCFIDDISPYVDATNFVNLKHNGTLTTLTVAVFGPF
jgi:hypothetical protein